MAKLLVKVRYEQDLRRIEATHVNEHQGRLQVFNGEKKVGEFEKESVEHWSFVEDENKF